MFELIKNYLPVIKNTILTNAKTISNCVKKGSNKFESFVNRHNLTATALLCIIVYFFAKLLLFTITMYQLNNAVDGNWTIIVTAVIGLITIYATAFSNNVTKQNINDSNNKTSVEINNNNNETELGKKWIDSDGDGKLDMLVDCEDESNADNFCENLGLI